MFPPGVTAIPQRAGSIFNFILFFLHFILWIYSNITLTVSHNKNKKGQFWIVSLPKFWTWYHFPSSVENIFITIMPVNIAGSWHFLEGFRKAASSGIWSVIRNLVNSATKLCSSCFINHYRTKGKAIVPQEPNLPTTNNIRMLRQIHQE